MAKLTPLGHRVVAKQVEKQTMTKSGFFLPEDAKEKPEMAEVVAVGPEVKDVKVGDMVIYKTYSSPIKVDGEELLILSVDSENLEKEGDILAVVK
jgi:chaperonin GroES